MSPQAPFTPRRRHQRGGFTRYGCAGQGQPWIASTVISLPPSPTSAKATSKERDMRRRGVGRGRPSLVSTVARTAVIAGTTIDQLKQLGELRDPGDSHRGRVLRQEGKAPRHLNRHRSILRFWRRIHQSRPGSATRSESRACRATPAAAEVNSSVSATPKVNMAPPTTMLAPANAVSNVRSSLGKSATMATNASATPAMTPTRTHSGDAVEPLLADRQGVDVGRATRGRGAAGHR